MRVDLRVDSIDAEYLGAVELNGIACHWVSARIKKHPYPIDFYFCKTSSIIRQIQYSYVFLPSGAKQFVPSDQKLLDFLEDQQSFLSRHILMYKSIETDSVLSKSDFA